MSIVNHQGEIKFPVSIQTEVDIQYLPDKLHYCKII